MQGSTISDGDYDPGSAFDRFAENSTIRAVGPYSVVEASCMNYTYDSKSFDVRPNQDVFYVQEDGTSIKQLTNLSSLFPHISSQDAFDEPSRHYFSPVWSNVSGPDPPLLVVVFLEWAALNDKSPMPDFKSIQSELPQPHTGTLSVKSCSISAYWTRGTMHQTVNQNLDLFTQTERISEMKLNDVREIALDITDLAVLRDANLLASMKNNEHSGEESEIPIVLATIFAHAISERPRVDKYWGYGTTDEKEDTMELTVVRYGYGYTTGPFSVRLAMAVITAYYVVTILYLAYFLITGTTSTTWNSAIELVALALQSRKPDEQGHTSVGIDCLDTFNKSVGIRLNGNDELELVFAKDRDFEAKGLRKIERNKAY